MILYSEPASYLHALHLLSGRYLVRAPERAVRPEICEDIPKIKEYAKAKHPLPCLVVIEDSLAPEKVAYVLVV